MKTSTFFKLAFTSFCLYFIVFQTFAQKRKKIATSVAPVNISVIQAKDRLTAYDQRKALISQSLFSQIKFRSVGPAVMSGRVADIAINEENPNEFYVGYAMGGLWHTSNNGQSFTPLFDNEAVIGIGAIAVDFSQKPHKIWIGTGESSSSRSTYAGLGMYYSADGGRTWTNKGLNESHHIGKVILHPTQPNTILVAAVGHLYTDNEERGVFKSSDGGATWKKVLYTNEKTGAIDLKIAPNNPLVMYATLWQKDRKAWNFEEGGAGSGIYKSVDGGDTWANVSESTSGFPQGNGKGRIGLAVDYQNAAHVFAIIDNQDKQDAKPVKENKELTGKQIKAMSKDEFLALSNDKINKYLDDNNFPTKLNANSLKEAVKSGKYTVQDIGKFTDNANDDLFDTPIKGAELYESTDGGLSWKRTHSDYLDGVFNTYGYYFGTVHISPSNNKKLVIPGFQLIMSEDGGKTFTGINADNVHADHHNLWINPKNDQHMILGNDGGINITYDAGKNWIFANTPPLAMCYAVNVDMATPYNVYTGLQDNGVWMGPSSYKASNEWHSTGQYPYKSVMGGDGMQVAVDTRDNTTIYTGYQFGNYFRINTKTAETKYLKMPQEIGETKNRFNWQSPIAISQHNMDVLYFGGNRLFRSMDKGDTWQAISADLTKGAKAGDVPFGTITTLSESPLKFGLLYAGTDDGNLQLSKDGGYTFQNIYGNMPANLWVSRVIASKWNEGRVIASLSGYRNDDFAAYLYASDDFGTNWTKIGKNLPAEPINVVKEDPENSNILYVGTDHGLYVSIDKGLTFSNITNNMPAVAVHDLVVHPRDKEIVVGTHGRSIYIASVAHLQSLNDSLLAKNLHVYPILAKTYSTSWGRIPFYKKYDKIEYQMQPISFWSKQAGDVKIEIQTNRAYTLQAIDVKAVAGLNFTEIPLYIKDNSVFDYQVQLNGARKFDDPVIKLDPADDGKVYLRPGKYTIVVSKNGKTVKEELEIKLVERKSRR